MYNMTCKWELVHCDLHGRMQGWQRMVNEANIPTWHTDLAVSSKWSRALWSRWTSYCGIWKMDCTVMSWGEGCESRDNEDQRRLWSGEKTGVGARRCSGQDSRRRWLGGRRVGSSTEHTWILLTRSLPCG